MEASLKLILTHPKNALVKQYQRLFEMEGVDLTVAEEALCAIAKKAIDRKTGARGLRSVRVQIHAERIAVQEIAIKKVIRVPSSSELLPLVGLYVTLFPRRLDVISQPHLDVGQANGLA